MMLSQRQKYRLQQQYGYARSWHNYCCTVKYNSTGNILGYSSTTAVYQVSIHAVIYAVIHARRDEAG